MPSDSIRSKKKRGNSFVRLTLREARQQKGKHLDFHQTLPVRKCSFIAEPAGRTCMLHWTMGVGKENCVFFFVSALNDPLKMTMLGVAPLYDSTHFKEKLHSQTIQI